MKTWTIEGDRRDKVMTALGNSVWFKTLAAAELEALVDFASLVSFEDGETIVRQGEASDSFFLLLKGVVTIESEAENGETRELGRVRAPFSFGEVGVLRRTPQHESIVAGGSVMSLKFGAEMLTPMIQAAPDFGINLARGLATRLSQVSAMVSLPRTYRGGRPADEVLRLLPVSFMERHRVLPLRMDDSTLIVGFVDPPTEATMAGLRQYLVGTEIESVAIDSRQFDDVLKTLGGADAAAGAAAGAAATPIPEGPQVDPRLHALLERMVAEGASDLHLGAGRKPQWRIDGDLFVVEDAPVLGATEVLDFIEPILDDRRRQDFEEGNDTDLGTSVPDLGRFRINLFRGLRGVAAAVRQIPHRVLAFEQLGLPPILKRLCQHPNGLVLVTGATGSGKTTTLAAMIDLINRTRRCHILTIEEPIEFVHEDRMGLVNQREVGSHTTSFARGLRAGMREDPDIVLVGEVRDMETMSLVLEVASSGHLVFATMHTSSVVGTLQLIVEMFPGDEQAQVRATLSDCLQGIVTQTLLRKRAGGRIPAAEVFLSNSAMTHLIREGRLAQIPNAMQSAISEGNVFLNEELARLVNERKVVYDEAMSKATDKKDLARRLGKEA